MKVLFLDIDGVLNNFHMNQFQSVNPGNVLSKPSCDALNHIIDEVPDLKIVVSSAWRRWGLQFMRDYLSKNNVNDAQVRVIDITGSEQGNRGYQIQCWLDRNPGVIGMVILDDESDMGALLPKLVKVNSFIGLTMAEAEKAVEILNK